MDIVIKNVGNMDLFISYSIHDKDIVFPFV